MAQKIKNLPKMQETWVRSLGWENPLECCDIEWFALEMNRDHSVIFEIASKYCISDSFVTMMATPFLLTDSCLE